MNHFTELAVMPEKYLKGGSTVKIFSQVSAELVGITSFAVLLKLRVYKCMCHLAIHVYA